MVACERSGKRPPPGSHIHALARAALATWLSPSKSNSTGGNGTAVGINSPDSTSPAPPSTELPPHASERCRHETRQQEARRDYLRHCLARSAIAAKAVGRAAKKATVAAGGVAPGESTVSALSAAGALPPAVAEEEGLCRFLLDEVDRVVAEAEAEDRCGDGGAAAVTPVPRAQRLLGLGLSATAPPASVGAVSAFLTAVLKHRLADAGSLRAVRAVACTLFQPQASPKQRQRASSRPPEAVAMQNRDFDPGEDTADREDEGGGEKKCGIDGGTVTTLPVLPGWSAATMLER